MSSAAPARSAHVAAALVMVLGSRNAEMPVTQRLITHGPRAFRLVRVFLLPSRLNLHCKLCVVAWDQVPARSKLLGCETILSSRPIAAALAVFPILIPRIAKTVLNSGNFSSRFVLYLSFLTSRHSFTSLTNAQVATDY